MLTQKRLKELLDYDPETGEFKWKIARQRVKIGTIAGSLDTRGYRQITVDSIRYYTHRLVWLYVNGKWPPNDMNHINGVKDDNRLANLREATRSETMQNQRCVRISNKSGFLGVSWHKRRECWMACIGINGKRQKLGCFDNAEEAHAAYLKAKAELHPYSTL